jgi:hypothetical protein
VQQRFSGLRRAAALALAAAMLLPFAAQSETECAAADHRGVQRCSAGLDQAQSLRMLRTQEKPHWCWAASISMLFAHYGIPVPQEQLVRGQFAELADRGVPGSVISEILGRSARDDGGRSFHPIASVADAATQRFELDAEALVEELRQQRPVLFGTQAHAMVLVRLDYERGASGKLRIVGATVVDPAPGQGVRKLLRQEMRPSYVAAVQLVPQTQLASAREAERH